MADFEIPENPDFVESVRKFEPTDPAHADLFNRVILALLESLAYLRKYKADMDYVDSSYQQGTGYTDKKIADLINGAPETLDTLKEIADAIAENKTIVEALDSAIGKKANQTELDTHTGNNVIHITSAEHEGLTEAIKHTKTEHVTGVKGSAESIYRTENVEITAENVGAVSQKEFDELNIGGTNLFQGTKEFEITNAKSFSNSVSSVTSETYNGLKIRKNLTAWNFYRPIISLEPGNYVFSGYVKGVNGLSANIQVNVGNTVLNSYAFSITSDFRRYSITFEITEKSDVTFFLESREAGEIYECGWKLEKGNKATDWSPAPEDLESALSIRDYNDTSKKIKVGWVGNSLSQDQILGVACYASGDDDTVKAKLKDVSKATFVNWLGTVPAANNAAHLGRNGNAGYPMTFNWAGKDGQPSWLWGGENGEDMYVYNPSNFSVNYAESAGSVNWAGIKDTPSTYPPEAHTHKLNIVSNSTFTINNYSDNPVSIVQTVDCGEYITMGNVNMRHYRLLLCTEESCIDRIVAEFDITKNNKLLVPVTSANPAKMISTSQNVNLYFDIHFNYSENLGGWSWSWDDAGYITIYGGSGTNNFSTRCFFWVDCWAQ